MQWGGRDNDWDSCCDNGLHLTTADVLAGFLVRLHHTIGVFPLEVNRAIVIVLVTIIGTVIDTVTLTVIGW